MKEAIFQNEIRQSFLHLFPDCFFNKLKDDAIFKESKTRFSPKKPFDMFVVYEGIPIAMELKQVKSPVPFAISYISEHQIANLKRFEKAGGISYILINYRYSNYNVAFATTVQTLQAIAEELDRVSVPLEILENEEGNIKKIVRENVEGEMVWNLRPLILDFAKEFKNKETANPNDNTN